MAGTSYTPRNIFSKYVDFSVTFPAADIDTNASGDVTLTIPHVKKIIEASVNCVAEGGYVANVQSVSKNQVTVRIYESTDGGTAPAAMTAVASATDVTILHVSGKAE